MANCPNKDRNLKNCNCTYSCAQKGLCCECVAAHRAAGEIPACFFSDAAERGWDRSVEAFIHDRG